VTDGAAAETWARKQLVVHFDGQLWEMHCAAHAWDLLMERVAKTTFMESIVKALNEIIAFIYQHSFVKALWERIQCVISMPRAAGTRFTTFHITVVACRRNEPAIRTLFTDPELKEWLLHDNTGKRYAELYEELAEKYVNQNSFWRRLEFFDMLFGIFVKALRIADNGQANLSPIAQSYFEVEKQVSEMSDDVAGYISERCAMSHRQVRQLAFDKQDPSDCEGISVDEIVNTVVKDALKFYKDDLIQPPVLAASICDPALIWADPPVPEFPGAMAAFNKLLSVRCNGDFNLEINVSSGLTAMRDKTGVFAGDVMSSHARNDLPSFWNRARTCPLGKALADTMAVPLLAANGASCCVERVHKRCKLVKNRLSNRRTDENVLSMVQMHAVWESEKMEAKAGAVGDQLQSVWEAYKAQRRVYKRKKAMVDNLEQVLCHAAGRGSNDPGSAIARPETIKQVMDMARETYTRPVNDSILGVLGADMCVGGSDDDGSDNAGGDDGDEYAEEGESDEGDEGHDESGNED